jgi:hypothetical protein
MYYYTGSFFGGRSKAINHYADIFYAYHDHWLAQDMFVGKDQMLMNSLVLLFPSHFFGVLLYDFPTKPGIGDGGPVNSPLGACGSTWWYYQWWLAEEQERELTADVWIVPSDGESTRQIDLLKGRPDGSRRCRHTRLTTAKELLRKEYGWWWWSPRASLTWGMTHRF